MAVDNFEELFNMVYIAKKLHDMGKYNLVETHFYDSLDYDSYFDSMYNLMGNIFEYYTCYCSESRMIELHIFSDPVIVDFYVLAGQYGKRHNIPDENNPYIEAAERKACHNLNFSYCLDWKLMAHTEPKRPFHSRLGLFIYQDDYVELGCLTYGLIEIYEWFSDKCVELRNILLEDAAGQLMLDLGVAAA